MNLLMEYGDFAMDLDDHEPKTYVNVKLLHINRFRTELNEIKNVILHKNMPEDDQISFLKSLVSYERKNSYHYTNSTYKTICGVRLEVLLPRKIKTVKEKRKLIYTFMKKINPAEYQIPWIAYEERRGTAAYIKILISEREYIDRIETITYNRNYYDKNGELIHKKGEPKLDTAGKPRKEHVLWSKKVRIFCFNKQKFKYFVKELITHFMTSVKSILHKISTRYRIKKKPIRGHWHYYNRKVCISINNAKSYVEFFCNYAVTLQKDSVHNPLYEDQRAKAIPVPLIKEISIVFHKYKKRFEKEGFHDQNGLLRRISYKHQALPELEENLNKLKEEFKGELTHLVPDVFQGRVTI